MEKTDVLIIGGSAAGIVAAVTAKSRYVDKKVTVIRKEEKVLVPCGIPYVFGSLESSNKNVIPDAMLVNAGVELKIGEVVFIDKENKICKTSNDIEISFEKLILATGSLPVISKQLKGITLDNVFTVQKDKEYLDKMTSKLKDYKKIVIVGGGFIGVEIADELQKRGKDVTIIEILPNILGLAFDKEIASRAEDLLKSRNVKIKTSIAVKEILGDKKTTGVLLDNGEEFEADVVILSMGYKPNTDLAQKAEIEVNKLGSIKVDEYMRTYDTDIFAVGDCAEKRDFITRKLSKVMLASTACSEARVAGMNLYNLSSVKTFSGTISIFATAFGQTGFATAGLTETLALEEGFDIVCGSFEGMDRHPGSLSNTQKQFVKLIVSRESGILLGGEVVGGLGTGELINFIGLAIQNKMTINSIIGIQIGTHPLLTASPPAYPFIKAAEDIIKKINNK
jgi:NADH oxidase (H2O2-forming)